MPPLWRMAHSSGLYWRWDKAAGGELDLVEIGELPLLVHKGGKGRNGEATETVTAPKDGGGTKGREGLLFSGAGIGKVTTAA